MARIRAIKPEFWSSPNIAEAPYTARLLYIAMWNWADDMGVGPANPGELRGFAFPNDDDITLDGIRRDLDVIRRVFGVMFYEVAGRPYFAIPSWEKHQKFDRRSKGKYPGPDQADPGSMVSDQEVYGDTAESADTPPNTRRDSVAGREEEGKRGTGEQFFSSEIASDPEPADDPDLRPDVEGLLDLLDLEIERNGNRPPKRNKTNRDAMRLLLDRDHATEQQVAYVIRWTQNDQFWKANILSAAKLREKYPQLVAKIRSEAERPARGTAPNKAEQRINDHRDIVARLAEREDTTEGELL